MADIRTVVEGRRRCGYRKKGGFYLILAEFSARACGKLPLPLDVCLVCGEGIRFSRGWRWINPRKLFDGVKCKLDGDCGGCILSDPPEKMGLLWIGEKFYPTPEDWIGESETMGISRRIRNVPREFEPGKTWVAVAHIKGISAPYIKTGLEEAIENHYLKLTSLESAVKKTIERNLRKPAIFQVFRPSHVEYVVRGDETEEELRALEERGIVLVDVVPEEKEEEALAEGSPKVEVVF